MTDEDNLRDRIASAVERADAEASDGGFAIAMPDHVAQAIIDEFGLEVVSGGGRPGQRQQIVGRWEKQ